MGLTKVKKERKKKRSVKKERNYIEINHLKNV